LRNWRLPVKIGKYLLFKPPFVADGPFTSALGKFLQCTLRSFNHILTQTVENHHQIANRSSECTEMSGSDWRYCRPQISSHAINPKISKDSGAIDELAGVQRLPPTLYCITNKISDQKVVSFVVASMSHTSPLLKHDGSTSSIVFNVFHIDIWWIYIWNKKNRPRVIQVSGVSPKLLDVFETTPKNLMQKSCSIIIVPHFSNLFPKKQLAIPWGHARKARRGRRHSPPRSERRRSMAATCTAAQAPVGWGGRRS
jgi:hypothetical protein